MNDLILTFIGRDSWDRPVYETEEGQLLVDTDPRCDSSPNLCTKSGNSFDGEPDTPIRYITKYKDVSIITFLPERDVW
jgi:hypothetical protein